MKVTIKGISNTAGNVEYIGIPWENVVIRDIHHKNGAVTKEIRIKRGKRDVRICDGVYQQLISVQEETTGRYILKHSASEA